MGQSTKDKLKRRRSKECLTILRPARERIQISQLNRREAKFPHHARNDSMRFITMVHTVTTVIGHYSHRNCYETIIRQKTLQMSDNREIRSIRLSKRTVS